jgi:hypothetical protein
MLDILLTVLAIVITGACVGEARLRNRGCSGLGGAIVGMIQQAYAAQSFRVGTRPGRFFGCRSVAVATVLARPAPTRRPPSPDHWSGDDSGPR